jgi:hypothetical protein
MRQAVDAKGHVTRQVMMSGVNAISQAKLSDILLLALTSPCAFSAQTSQLSAPSPTIAFSCLPSTYVAFSPSPHHTFSLPSLTPALAQPCFLRTSPLPPSSVLKEIAGCPDKLKPAEPVFTQCIAERSIWTS